MTSSSSCTSTSSLSSSTSRTSDSEGESEHCPMPSPPCWVEGLTDRAMWRGRVLLPCAGVDAPGEAMRKLQWPVKCVGLWDVSNKVAQIWAAPPAGISRECLHLGPVAGDIMRVKLASLPDAEAIISGPPCPPWSSIGRKRAAGDKRASIFWRVVTWCGCLARRNVLQFFVFENVAGIAHKHGGVSCLTRIVRALKSQTGFSVKWWRLNSKDFGVAQHRPRVYIVGVRTSLLRAKLAKPLPTQCVPLRHFLIPGLRGTNLRSLTTKQRANLQEYMRRLKAKRQDANLKGTFAAFRVDRRADGGFRQERSDDLVPTLTTSNRGLWVMALGEGLGRPSVHRLLHANERAALQGFDRWRELPRQSTSAAIFVLGNAMTVPVVACVLNAVALSMEGKVLRAAQKPPASSSSSSSSTS